MLFDLLPSQPLCRYPLPSVYYTMSSVPCLLYPLPAYTLCPVPCTLHAPCPVCSPDSVPSTIALKKRTRKADSEAAVVSSPIVCAWLPCPGLRRAGLRRAGLRRTGLRGTGLPRNGLGWSRPDWPWRRGLLTENPNSRRNGAVNESTGLRKSWKQLPRALERGPIITPSGGGGGGGGDNALIDPRSYTSCRDDI